MNEVSDIRVIPKSFSGGSDSAAVSTASTAAIASGLSAINARGPLKGGVCMVLFSLD